MLAALAIVDKLGIRNVRGPMHKWEMRASPENYKIPPLFRQGKYEYLVEDIFKHQGRYDWINSSLTLTHFDHRKLFPRIADLLEDGGIFTFTVECWWYPVNSTQIVGFAPYICQRLPREDVLRYFRENHPDGDLDKIADVYDYYVDKPQPTASIYIETAARHGLHPVIFERHFNPKPANKRSAIPPPYLEREIGEGPRHALENIRKFRNDVSLEDLYTSHYLLGFRKVAI
jgi:SAM-dependent methyltransferase